MSAPRIVPLGDSCVAIQFGGPIDPHVNARCVALAASLETLGVRGVRDVVPSYNAVTVHFNPRVADRAALKVEIDRLVTKQASTTEGNLGNFPVIDIPVTYGGEAGPDLPAVAEFARCSETEVVRLHTATTYHVYMLGFLPGFPYMGTIDARIALPRLETPRLRVPAGSVGIAGPQTGIYPTDSPGGWRIIGRTSVNLFDLSRREPFLLKAGDRVRFAAV